MPKKQTFVRFGGLGSVNQLGYDPSMPSHHSPPARSGIYAMPSDRMELFLVSGSTTDHHPKSKREDMLKPYYSTIKNSNGESIKLGWDYHYYGRKVALNATPKELSQYIAKDGSWKKSVRTYTIWKKDTEDYSASTFLYTRLLVRDHPKHFKYTGLLWCHLHTYVAVKHSDVIKTKGDWILLQYSDWLKYYNYAKSYNKYRYYSETREVYDYGYDDFEVFIEKV